MELEISGKNQETKIGAMIEAGLNFGCSLILVRPLGIVGVTIGTLAANCFRTIQYAIYASANLIEREISYFLKRILWLLVCVASIMIVYYNTYLCIWNVTNYLNWILKAMACMGLSIVVTITWSLFLYRSDFFNSMKLVSRMVNKRK